MEVCSITQIIFLMLILFPNLNYGNNFDKEEIFVIENDTVVLQCKKETDNVMPIWTCPGEIILTSGNQINPEKNTENKFSIIKDKTGDFNLQIRNFSKAEEGRYQCTTDTKSGITDIIYHVSVLRPPSNIAIDGEDKGHFVYGIAGNDIKITCRVVKGIPDEMITWSNEMDVIKTGGPKNLAISIVPDKSNHLKHFTCRANNTATTVPIERSVQLYVIFPPSVEIKHEVVNVTDGKRLTLTCNFSSNYINTTLNWYRLAESGSWNVIPNMVKDYLHFDTIKRSDSGKYRCLVTNPAGITEYNVTINVQYAPHVTIDNNGNRTLQCIPNGNPDHYTFFKWEHRSDYDDFIRFLPGDEDGRLVLPNITNETDRHYDRGKYICVVSNGIEKHGKSKQSREYTFNPEGLPYFVSSNNARQSIGKGERGKINIYVVSQPNLTSVDIFNMSSRKWQDVKHSNKPLKVLDEIYGRNVYVKGFHLQILIPVLYENNDKVRICIIGVRNSCGTANFTVYLSSASNTSGTATQYIVTGLLISVGLAVVILFACVRTFGGRIPKLNLIVRCLKCQSSRNAALDDVGGVENDGYGVQNAMAASSNQDEIPVYSSIERKKNISIASSVSYSVNNRQKPDPRHHHKQVTDENDQTSKNMNQAGQSFRNTIKKQEKQELNYIEVSFDKKSNEDKLEIHGLDQRSTYIDIDFSRKVDPLPESDSDDNSDNDFASVEDLRRMRKSRLPEH